MVQAMLGALPPAHARLPRDIFARMKGGVRDGCAWTLVVHARDDGINPLSVAERLVAGIEGAELLAVDTGGHLLLGQADAVRRRIQRHMIGGR